MMAAAHGHASVVNALLDGGADIDIKNKNRERATSLAKAAGHKKIVAILEHRKENSGMLSLFN